MLNIIIIIIIIIVIIIIIIIIRTISVPEQPLLTFSHT